MREQADPRQLALFPELARHSSIPSITTLPAFDRALNNLIKMSDLGAFIQLTIQGLERVYSINLRELDIPSDFLKQDPSLSPFSAYLFPTKVRNKLKKISYDVKSFFNNKNSFRTSFGYFLFRSHFTLWKHYLNEMDKNIQNQLFTELGHGTYQKYFMDQFLQGYNYLNANADDTAPWEFQDKITIQDIEKKRTELKESHFTLANLKATEIDYPFSLVTAKTNHIPLSLKAYVSNIQISSIFKVIHLEYLADKSIQSIDDIKKLIDNM
jgi:hypothetical protein